MLGPVLGSQESHAKVQGGERMAGNLPGGKEPRGAG